MVAVPLSSFTGPKGKWSVQLQPTMKGVFLGWVNVVVLSLNFAGKSAGRLETFC